MKESMHYPVRINRYLAHKGFSTRKGADDLIRAGLVRINGKQARLGDHVQESDMVLVAKGRGGHTKDLLYVAYYKPRGVVTHSPRKGERSIEDSTRLPGVFPVGRLDKDSEGLMILTNDGRITDRLLHPRFVHEKEYEVEVREKVRPFVKKILEGGVVDAGEKLAAKKVLITGAHMLTIVLTEGKKHQIRRMLAHVRLTVLGLKRTRIMDIRLESLTPGQSRVLTGKSREKFLVDLGLGEL